jgi:adenosine/AMP kinase
LTLAGTDGRPQARGMELHAVPIELPESSNVIVGQAHFIKTIVDLHETLASSAPTLRFGAAFCEASDPRLVRRSGNDTELTQVAVDTALAIGAGHCFVVFLRDGFPLNVMNQVMAIREVCGIFCATANPLEVLVAETERGRGILGVVDGETPLGVETEEDVADRLALLRDIGYRL